MKKYFKIVVIFFGIAFLFAFPPDTVKKKGVEMSFASRGNEFGFNLLSEVIKQDKEKNIFISPFSISCALTMTYNGAKGETKAAMAKVLGLEKLSLDEVNQAVSELQKKLAKIDPRVKLLIANSLWARKGIKFKNDFLKRTQKSFQAEITALDFKSPKARKRINQWVDKKTQGKIKEIIKEIPPLAVLYLINALYFNGKWQKKFDPTKTKKEAFNVLNKGKKDVWMMTQSGRFLYYQGEGFQAVNLPYGDGRISMYIFLPDANSNIYKFLEGLNTKNWLAWLDGFNEMEGEIKLPKFQLEYENSLVAPLSSLGMEIVFDPQKADFTGMRTEGELFISDVKHKAVCEVAEKGTEAAAVTSIEISLTAIQKPEERFTFIVDRPFFFAIRDNSTEAVLFLGVVVDPS